jgi:hypothetical protein
MLKVSDIPPHIGYYLAGFADGEGNFNIHQKDFQKKISLSFKVSRRDKVILALFKKHLKCGTLRNSSDGMWHYEVSNLNALVENVIPFFKKFGFLSATKKRDFSKFKQAAEILFAEEPLTEISLKNILKIKSEIDSGLES